MRSVKAQLGENMVIWSTLTLAEEVGAEPLRRVVMDEALGVSEAHYQVAWRYNVDTRGTRGTWPHLGSRST